MALAVLAAGAFGAPASAQDAAPCKAASGEMREASRDDLERRLTDLLTRGEEDGVSHRATFEGCVLVQRLNYDRRQQELRGYNYIEKKIDVRLLATDLCTVQGENADKERYVRGGNISVFYLPRPNTFKDC